MVEALVVIPFFVLVFVCVVFMGGLYGAKLRVMRLTRESAWSYAIANCGTPGDPLTSTHGQSSEAPKAADGDSDEPPDFSEYSEQGTSADEGKANAGEYGGEMGKLASQDFGSSVATMEEPVSVSAGFGSFSKNVSSRTRVMCNEPPYNGNFMGFLNAGYNALKKIF
jgi:hypothetical protein